MPLAGRGIHSFHRPTVMSAFVPYGFGWHRDIPDIRDYVPQREEVVQRLQSLEPLAAVGEKADWRDYFGLIADQGPLATSVPHACAGLVQYFERRATGRVLEPSVLFVYQVAKRLLGWRGDSGVTIRTALRAIAQFGLPPANAWPDDPPRAARWPDAHAYAAAWRPPHLSYVRLDGWDEPGRNVLQAVRCWLAAGFPCVCGFPVPGPLPLESEIPYPTLFDSVRGGQAVIAVGYDDRRRCLAGRGALLLRSSWGAGWGESGYGWLPYAYVRKHLAVDFWTLLSPDWLASGEFHWPP